jgi:F0F1-type ATP synthase assembly protein I
VRLDRQSLQAFSYSTLGLELVLSIVIGLFGGRWLDGKLGTEPVLTFVGLGFGLAAGFRFVYRAATRMRAETEKDGFRAAQTDRTARFALNQKHEERHG